MFNKIKHLALAMLAVVGMWGQSQTPHKVYPSAAGAAAETRLYTSGGTFVGFKAPASVATDIPFVLPNADGFPGQCLQTDGSGNWVWDNCSGGGGVSATDYDWSQTPGGSLVVGSNTVSLAPCPSDFTGAAADFPIRLSGGTGTAETVIVTGGSGSYGDASCNVTFTAAYTHTGAWTASSASGGLIEAVRESTGVGVVRLPDGTLEIDPPAPGALTNVWIYAGVQVVGVGYGRSQIQLNGDQYAMIAETTSAVIFRDFFIIGNGAQASGGGLKITSDGLNHNCASIVEDVAFQALYNGIYFDKQCTPFIKNNRFYNIDNVAIHLENTWCADCGDPTVIGNYIQDDDNVSTCLYWVNGGGAKVIGNKFLGCSIGMDVQAAPDSTVGTDATSIAIVTNNSFDQNTSRGIRLDGTITFVAVQVNNNTFTPNGAATSYIGVDYGNSASTLFFNAAINNNVFHCTDALNNTAIRVRSSTFTTIAGNTISYCLVGITVESTALSVSIGRNDFFGSGTFYNVDAAATFLPTAQIRQVSSASNVWSLAEYIQPTSAGNNAIILGNPSTGTASQRGLFWGYNAADFGIARFDSSRVAAPTFDFYIETDGDSLVYNRLGVGISPTYQLDIGGGAGANYLRIADSTAGTSLLAYAENGATNIGALTNHSLRMLTDNTVRWQISAAGMLLPWADDTYDIGDLSSARVRAVYAKYIDTAETATTGDYVKSRLFRLTDAAGGAGYWDMWTNASIPGNSNLAVKDNAGSRLFVAWRGDMGTPVNYTYWYGDILPGLRNTADGDAVTDLLYPSLGSASRPWGSGHISQLYVPGTVNSDLVPFGANTYDLGESAYRWRKLWAVDGDISSTLTVGTATNTVDLTASGTTYLQTTGIGEASPAKGLLSVYGHNGYAYTPYNIVASTRFRTGANSAMLLGTTTGNTSGWTRGLFWSYQVEDLAFSRFKDDESTVPIHDLYISQGGLVGINTTSPTQVLTVSGSVDVIGAGTFKMGGTTVVDASRNATVANLTITGTCTGCGGGGLPVPDTDSIVRGSADGTKLLRFEVDGFTTGTTRILTPQNASYTLAGTDLAQTFTDAQTFNGTVNLNNGFSIGGSGILNSSRLLSNVAYVNQNWLPYDTTMNLGSSSLPWNSLYLDSTLYMNAVAVVDSSRNGYFAQGQFSGAVTMTTAQMSGNLTPLGGSPTIGTSVLPFTAAYAYDIVAVSNLWVGGSTILNSSRIMNNVAYVNQNWLPYDTSMNLGSSSLPWNSLYLDSSLYMNAVAVIDSSRNGYFAQGQFTGSVTMPSATMSGNMIPSLGGGGSIGTGAVPYGSVYADNITANSSLTATGGITTGASSNSTIFVGTGNFYMRTFSGGDANCTGVTDGWVGIRTDTTEIQVCIGGAVKKGALI